MLPTRRRAAVLAMALVPALALATFAASPGSAVATAHQGKQLPHWKLRPVATDQQFRGLDAVSRKVAWVGGSKGSVFRTVNGGRTWQDVSPGDSAGLLFRDVEAFDRNHAVILAIGEADASRVYRTNDGGATWTRTFTNDDPAAFYDCMAFLDRHHGLAMSDPVDGKFRIIATRDGGRHWTVRDPAGMPDALTGEFGFAASGTCLTARKHTAWFASGGGAEARVFRSHDLGRTWKVASTPVASSAAGGIFSLAFRDPRHGFAIGGDFTATGPAVDALATTRNGGRTWQLVPADRAPEFYRSGSAFVAKAAFRHARPGTHGWWHRRSGSGLSRVALAVGPTGSDISFDGGHSWRPFDPDAGGFDAVECAADGACWASEQNGRVARLAVPRHR